MTSFMAEPLLTGLGAGGYMLVAPPGGAPVLLDFMVEAAGPRREPGDARAARRGRDRLRRRRPGLPHRRVLVRRLRGAGRDRVRRRALRHRAAGASWPRPRSRSRATGVEVNETQAYLWELLGPIATSTPESCDRYCVDGRVPRAGEIVRDPDLADGIERLAADGAAPFYTGDIGTAVSDWVTSRGGTLTRATWRRTRPSRASRCTSATTAARC